MGRPPSPTPSASTLRKRRQIARARSEGRRIVLLTPTEETLIQLEALAKLTGGSVKGETEAIVRRAVRSAMAEAEALAAKMGPIFLSAKQYLPYSRFLEHPGATYRVKDRKLRYNEWEPLAVELAAFYHLSRRWGWSRKRADGFLERAAAAAPGKQQ